jgi:hypothetical protein
VIDFAQILKVDYNSGDCLDADAFPTTSILKLEETASQLSKATNSSNASVFQNRPQLGAAIGTALPPRGILRPQKGKRITLLRVPRNPRR